MRRYWIVSILAGWMCLCLGGAAWAASSLAINGVRLGVAGDTTRFVLDLNQKSPYRLTILRDPYRLQLTLPQLQWRLLPGLGQNGRGLIQKFTYGALDGDSFRLVLELNAPARIKQAQWLDPGPESAAHRLVIDITAAPDGKFAVQNFGDYQFPVPKPKPAIARPAPKPENTVRKKVIVLDAGHGGVDPGAIGRKNTYEKNITLTATQELAALLNRNPDYRVIMTRQSDIFIPLRERVKIARAAKADLFISLHADHHHRQETRGVSVYTLSNQASDAESAKLAEQENKADLLGGEASFPEDKTVSDILMDLVQQETMGHAVFFGQQLVTAVAADKKIITLRQPLRSAGFAVLRAPDIPSVLIELGFLSNLHDEAALNNPDYRSRLIRAISEAIDGYFTKIHLAPQGISE